jgi:plasmid stabilization system protein ParE
VHTKLQALNAALPALGLTNAQIQQIDRIVTLVHNFNPAAYANLVNEFEAQTQQAVEQSAANSAAGVPATALPATVPNGAHFQVEDIVIHLTGIQHSLNNASQAGGGQGTDGYNAPGAPAPLQVEQVQFRFVNGNGQTFQLSTPQRPSSAATTSP